MRSLLSFCALVGVFYLSFIRRMSFWAGGDTYYTLFDDAMISMRYARNLAEGYGLNWNYVGAPVEGFTNMLWTLWMAFLHLLPIPEPKVSLAVMLTSAVLLLVNLYVMDELSRRLNPSPTVRWVTLFLTAVFYPLLYWSLRGMEVGLITVLLNASLLLAIEILESPRDSKMWGLASLLSISILTRPDTIVFVCTIPFFVLLFLPAEKRKSFLAINTGLVGATVLGISGFRYFYFGDFVPNTFHLKVGGAGLFIRMTQGWEALWNMASRGFGIVLLLAIAALRFQAKYLLLWSCALLHVFYSIYVGGDAWEWMGFANRFITTVSPLIFLLSADLVFRAKPRFVVVYGVLALFLLNFENYKMWWKRNVEHYYDDIHQTRMGLHLRESTAPDATIAVVWAGAAPYFSRRNAVDLLGKSDPHVARVKPSSDPSLQPGHTKWDYPYSIGTLHPDVVVNLWKPTPEDYSLMEKWGYEKLPNELWVQAESPRVTEKLASEF